ncbi:hypothetical protein ABRY23_11005 [Melioribacteraceae bacterium 4301-Me]|uniref:hypothetical protein n=1 Tax=Pyranulibacter aquaticus TaxID=3163344 RepID=UPI003595F6F6
MLGLYFSIIGLIFGFSCSAIAKRKNRNAEDWFMLGFIFLFVAYLWIRQLPTIYDANNKRG